MRTKPLLIGGLTRCCIKTIDSFDDRESKDGDEVKCEHCSDKITLKDGKWQWVSTWDGLAKVLHEAQMKKVKP